MHMRDKKAMEIGGYIEFETYAGRMLHGDGILLNCGRNALAYLIEVNHITDICMPAFMCDSCDAVLAAYGVRVRYYSIDEAFHVPDIVLREGEWLYAVNYYGQLSRDYIKALKGKYVRLILDNAQAYFCDPIEGIETIYTCRKFFGVADGAILYSSRKIERPLEQDVSFNRMEYLLGRFEISASQFYEKYVENNRLFGQEKIKRMSKLTENLLRGIDYDAVSRKRTDNFLYLHDRLKTQNRLSVKPVDGAFMYPFYVENGERIRKRLQEQKIYIPILWPAVFDRCTEDDLEFRLARDILPLPVDQRYGREEMDVLINALQRELDKQRGE